MSIFSRMQKHNIIYTKVSSEEYGLSDTPRDRMLISAIKGANANNTTIIKITASGMYRGRSYHYINLLKIIHQIESSQKKVQLYTTDMTILGKDPKGFLVELFTIIYKIKVIDIDE